MTFGTEKQNCVATRRWKKIWRHVYSFWQNARTWQTDRQTDRRTDRHHMTAKTVKAATSSSNLRLH